MTPAEYEARMRRLSEDVESARVSLNSARSHFERLCEEAYNLRITYHREQHAAVSPVAGQDGGQ